MTGVQCCQVYLLGPILFANLLHTTHGTIAQKIHRTIPEQRCVTQVCI